METQPRIDNSEPVAARRPKQVTVEFDGLVAQTSDGQQRRIDVPDRKEAIRVTNNLRRGAERAHIVLKIQMFRSKETDGYTVWYRREDQGRS